MPADNRKRRKRKKLGRPRKGYSQLGLDPNNITPEQIYNLAKLSVSGSEIASLLGITRDTLYKNLVFNTALKRGHDDCNASLRRKQYEIAAKGNVTMLIWLGKNRLGQKDRHEYDQRQKDRLKELLEAKQKGLLNGSKESAAVDGQRDTTVRDKSS